jgi:hypothetical protein
MLSALPLVACSFEIGGDEDPPPPAGFGGVGGGFAGAGGGSPGCPSGQEFVDTRCVES